ncbi:MAG: hypothetical protein U0904_12125, partial [Candidatus Nanopelagicales bacterium]|nr:hypothetical protein [Candidatus Nanopelagicales bacterium]
MKRLLIAAMSISLVGITILAGPSATGRQPPASGDSGTGSSPAGSAPWSATNALAGDSNTPAEGTLRNDELVVASLDPLGLPVTANLISRVSSSGGPQRTIVDPTSTSDIAYLNKRGQPTVVGKGIEVTVGGQEPVVIITKAEFDRTLPVALHAEYVLNGQVVDPQDVVGASGDVAIRFTVTNVDVKQQKL